jgi:hypothetical protein
MRVPTGWTARLRFRDDRAVAAALAIIALAVYLTLIVGHRTPSDHFARLAQALWEGRYWLEGAPLPELDPGRGGHLYNIQPPGPTLLLLFLVPFGSSGQIEVFLAAALGAPTAVPQSLALRALTVPRFHRTLTVGDCLDIFRAMVLSRLLDHRELTLQKQMQAWFSIFAAGKEAVLAAAGKALRPTDPIWGYYRDRALCLQRGMTAREMLMQAVAAR